FPALFFLVVFMLILNTGRFAPRKIKEAIMAALSLIVASIFCWYCLAHLPLKDYRPFAVGKNIRQQMEIPEGKEAPKYAVDYGLVNKKTGEEKTINSDEYVKSGIWKDDSWEISSTSEPYLVKEGYVPPIQDFGIFNLDGDDMSEEVLSAPVCFLVVSKDVNEAAERGLADLNRLAQKAEEKGYLFIGLTPSSYDEVEDFRHRHQLMWTFAMADETMLKTMIRSNTGLILLNKGTIVGKWHYNDFPTFGDLKKQFSL
ncbi:MAG: hypothetical protein ACE5DN_07690, partial [Flavobacteriales bacterium]